MPFFPDVAKLVDEVEKVAKAADSIKVSLREIADILAFFKTVLVREIGPVGFVWTQGQPHPRSNEGESVMAKAMSCKLVKKSAGGRSAAAPMKRGDPPPTSIAIQDNEDGSLTVMGYDAAGALVDASAIATLSDVSSSDTTILTVDPPAGLTVATHGLKPGDVSVTGTVTLNDGSSGPFVITISGKVNPGPAVGFIFVPGAVSVRP